MDMWFILFWILLPLIAADLIQAYRLSREVKPDHYSLTLHPNIDKGTFRGEVTITFRTIKNEKEIILHSSQLNITEVTANYLPAVLEPIDNERILVKFKDGVYFFPGENKIHFKFVGDLHSSSGGYGLMKASYQYNNYSGLLVVNEFEPTNARRAFPCFDEPSFKAKFNVRLVTPNDSYVAVSNMPEIARYPTNYGIIYDFATTVKMSTYLLSFAVTDYSYYEEIFDYNNKQIPIRVYTYNASKENNKYAIEGAKAAIEFYSNYTGIEYPLPKLDMIEYNKGKIAATETWGLIQFKEGLLTKNLNLYDSWQCHYVIFHELAHFWFGNLVTNDWWNDLWLQEGFATFMSHKSMSVDHRHKSLGKKRIHIMELFEVEQTQKPSTLPLVSYLPTTKSIERRFDGIIYTKGAFLLEALEAVVHQESFQKTVQEFLRKFAFQTATTNDLISLFESHNPNKNLRSFLESYIFQTGFPVINVEGNNGNYVLTQMDIYKRGPSYRWTIPISIICGNATPSLLWFDKDADSIQANCPNNTEWFMLSSIKRPGIYVVNYTQEQWDNLITHFKDIPSDEATNLAENAGALYLSKLINCDIILQLVAKMERKSFMLFKVILKIASQISCYGTGYEVLGEYLSQHMVSVENILLGFNNTCNPEDNEADSEVDMQTQQCSQWISSNLDNFIKPKVKREM